MNIIEEIHEEFINAVDRIISLHNPENAYRCIDKFIKLRKQYELEAETNPDEVVICFKCFDKHNSECHDCD